MDIRHTLPEAKKYLVLAPHMDDEALGCGGTILLLNRRGASSSVVFLTNGEKLYDTPSPAIGLRRAEEAREASKMLGCSEALFLGFPDGEIGRHSEAIYRKLHGIIIEEKPDIVFSPSPVDHHDDHIATSKLAMGLLRELASFRLAFYEVYSTIRFNHLIDISEVVEQKKKVILNYRTSLYEKPDVYVQASLGLNAHRSIFVQKSGYYEAFYVTEGTEPLDHIADLLCYRYGINQSP